MYFRRTGLSNRALNLPTGPVIDPLDSPQNAQGKNNSLERIKPCEYMYDKRSDKIPPQYPSLIMCWFAQNSGNTYTPISVF